MRGDDGELKQLMPEALMQFDWQRIESAITGGGIPDLNYCWRGLEGWVECKRTTAWAVNLDPKQVAWLTRRARHGGRVFIAVRRMTRNVDELHVIPGEFAREVRLGGLAANLPGRVSWAGGPGGWSWRAVAELLAPGPVGSP